MLTEKAMKEMEKLQWNLNDLLCRRTQLVKDRDANNNWRVRELILKDIRKITDQEYRIDEKIDRLGKEEISTGERATLLRETLDDRGFVTTLRDKSLGHTSYTKVGWSRTLNSFVLVDLSVYSDFMRNVQGCSSLAGKRSLTNFARLTETEADAILQKGSKQEVNFIGHEERVVPITKTAAQLRA